MSTHKRNLPKFLVKKFGEEQVRNLISPDEKILPVSAMKRTNRNNGQKKRIVSALRHLRSRGDTWFRTRDAAAISGVSSPCIGNTLKFTSGVRFVAKGVWEFTGEPLAVES